MHPLLSTQTGTGVLFGVLVTARALAAPPSCDAVGVEATPEVSARWPGLPERVERALEGRDDIDRCAQIRLGASTDSITVEVVLDDGRSAVRRASTDNDAVVALEALLLIPEQAPEATPVDSPQTTRTHPAESVATAGHSNAHPTAAATPRERTGLSELDAPVPFDSDAASTPVHLAVVGGARVGDAQVSQNLGVLAVFGLSDWLLGADGRAAEYTPGATPTTTLELTALGGRRIDNSNVALDLMVGPSFVLQQSSETERTPDRTVESKGSRVVPRLLMAAHLRVFPRSTLGGFVGIEGFVAAPGSSRSDGPSDVLIPLPTWMVGLAIGAMVNL